MEEKSKIDYIIIAIFVVAAIGVIFLFNRDNKQTMNPENGSSESNANYKKVTDQSDFFTVESCVNKYIGSLTDNNVDDLMKLLNQDYIKENGINSSNVLNKLGSLSGKVTFLAKKIYYVKSSSNIVDYYVYGLVKKELLNGDDLGSNYYVIVRIDANKQLFDITPYDGKIFVEGIVYE